MAKRISVLILSTAIMAIGIIAFNRLHYWERSVQIINMNNEQSIRRGFDRHRGDFGGRERHERLADSGNRFERQNIGILPDSTRQRIFVERNSATSPGNQTRGRLRSFPAEREDFRSHSFERGGRHGRGDFRRENNVQLANVSWFLAVFALFTAATVFLDKGYKLIRQRNKIAARLKT